MENNEFESKVRTSLIKIEQEKEKVKKEFPNSIFVVILRKRDDKKSFNLVLGYNTNEENKLYSENVFSYTPDSEFIIQEREKKFAIEILLKEYAKLSADHGCDVSGGTFFPKSVEHSLDWNFLNFILYFAKFPNRKNKPISPKKINAYFEDNFLILTCEKSAVAISSEKWKILPELQKVFVRDSLRTKKCKFNKDIWKNIFEEEYN